MTVQQIENAIEIRVSTRTFANLPVNSGDLDKISDYLDDPKNRVGPFGNQVNLRLVIETANKEKEKLGTYGFIQHAQAYIIGSCASDTLSLFDYAFVLENVVLRLTIIGISTCWLGGRFKKQQAISRISLRENEIIPAIVVMGYPAEKIRLKEQMIRSVLQARKRKPESELFFYETFSEPLGNRMGVYQKALHFLRIAPSAQNKQPWRLLFNSDLSQIHFYTTSPLGTHPLYMCDPAFLDIGIAFNHFQTGLDLAGITGKLKLSEPNIETPEEYSYITSWIKTE